MIIVTAIPNSQCIIILGGIVIQIVIPICLSDRVSVCRIEKVATVKFNLLTPFIWIVNTQWIDFRNTTLIANHKIGHITTTTMTSSTTIIYRTDYTQNIIDSKVLLIDIVGHTDNRESSLIIEDIQARSDIVFVIKSILSRELSEHPVIHSTTGYQINCLVSFTIIDTTKFRLVT